VSKARVTISDGRIRNLADGVFSIAMTLLVLSLKLSGDGPLPKQVLETLPKIGIYFLAFIQLGVIWVAHTYEMDFEKEASRWYSWCNLLLFMFVALLPFSVSVLGDHPTDPVSSLVYGANMVFIELTLMLYWVLCLRRFERDLDPRQKLIPIFRTAVGLALFVISIPLAFLDTRLSFAMFIIVPVLYILPLKGETKRSKTKHAKPDSPVQL
jgi:uncharacterized membrane protein